MGKYEGFSLDLDFLRRLFALGFNVCDITSPTMRITNREQIKRGERWLTAVILKQTLVMATYMHQFNSKIHATIKRLYWVYIPYCVI